MQHTVRPMLCKCTQYIAAASLSMDSLAIFKLSVTALQELILIVCKVCASVYLPYLFVKDFKASLTLVLPEASRCRSFTINFPWSGNDANMFVL